MIQALHNYIQVEMIRQPERIGVIQLTTKNQGNPKWGKAISVGPGVPDFNGVLREPDVKIGQLVYVMTHGLMELNYLGQKHSFASVLNCICTWENEMIQPLGNYIEIEKKELEDGENKISMIEEFQMPGCIGTVKRLGLGYTDLEGERLEFQVQEGDTVFYDPFKLMVIDLAALGIDEKRYIIAHGDILGKLDNGNS